MVENVIYEDMILLLRKESQQLLVQFYEVEEIVVFHKSAPEIKADSSIHSQEIFQYVPRFVNGLPLFYDVVLRSNQAANMAEPKM